MPLILICGLPSSGKTYRAKQIVRYLEDKVNGTEASHTAVEGVGSSTNGSTDAAASAVKELSALNLEEASSTSTAQTSLPYSAKSPSPKPASSSTSSSTRLSPPKRKIYHISDHSLGLPRSVYSNARSEKDARAALYSAVKRVLTRNDIVVLDSGNYIKGWRYQLYCEAKNTVTASCVVHVGVPAERCRENNESRLRRVRRKGGAEDEQPPNDDSEKPPLQTGGLSEDDPYDNTVFEELLMRFEEPNAMARWDQPLYTVPWDDASPPCDQIWEETIQGVGKDGKSRTIRPNQAAVLTPASSTSHLYILDRTTQSVLAAIQAHQRQHPDDAGAGTPVVIPLTSTSSADSALSLTLPPQPLSFPYLQRLRRQFITLHRQQMGGLGMGGIGGGLGDGERSKMLSEGRVAELFVGFLGERFEE